MTDRREMLLQLAKAVNADQSVSVPAGWLLEALDGPAAPAAAGTAVDITVADVAARFGRKSTSTIRIWCEKGLLPGAYRLHGREWRIPESALQALQEAHRENARRLRVTPAAESATDDMGDWRQFRQGVA